MPQKTITVLCNGKRRTIDIGGVVGSTARVENIDLSNCSLNKVPSSFKNIPGDWKWIGSINLSNNNLTSLKGLAHLDRIDEGLFAANNKITEIPSLPHTSLGHLILANNKITEMKNLPDSVGIELSLAGNQIRKVEGLAGVDYVELINLKNNRIASANDVKGLRCLPDGVTVCLHGNPMGQSECRRVKMTYPYLNIQCDAECNVLRTEIGEALVTPRGFESFDAQEATLKSGTPVGVQSRKIATIKGSFRISSYDPDQQPPKLMRS